jgi:GT2 family glycosyltransferase
MTVPRRDDGVTADGGEAPITVFIVSWGRPLYLWACLDALFRKTRTPARFVLLDNAHPDPTVSDVIAGFERRGMFAEVVRFATNSFSNITEAYRERLDGLGPLHAYVESDCVVDAGHLCWLAEMRRVMDASPSVGVLGSLIDPTDFVGRDVAEAMTGGDAAKAEFLAKLKSPERAFLEDSRWQNTTADYFATVPPCPILNPPGRLMMLRTEPMQEMGFQLDAALAQRMREKGFEPAVTPRVRHRHLSLLNVYDYLDYDQRSRDAFFTPPPAGPS